MLLIHQISQPNNENYYWNYKHDLCDCEYIIINISVNNDRGAIKYFINDLKCFIDECVKLNFVENVLPFSFSYLSSFGDFETGFCMINPKKI